MKTCLAICTPMPIIPGPQGPRLEPVTVEFLRARRGLAQPTNTNVIEITVDGKEVGEARCEAVKLAMGAEPRPEFLFFLDYDVLPQFDAITKLMYRARCFPDYDLFSGVYCCKGSPAEPLIYQGNGGGPYWDWAMGDLLTTGITGVHMGCTLIRMSLFERMESAVKGTPAEEKPLFLTYNATSIGAKGIETRRGTEDLFFCQRATEEADAKILVDTSVLCGHIQNSTGQIFGLPKDSPPVKRAKWMANGEDDKKKPATLKAIDLGAGGLRRRWDGYETETTDIRSDVEADYAMDTRRLNFPNAHFDLVASSHHLEHFSRSEQEVVWKEMVRILKPGGKMEHIVPNLEWAAAKISEGDPDEHTFDVLYGAQEAHGYERDFNTHYFGYTPAIAESMADLVGLENVEVATYKDDPNLGYNMVIKAEKPAEKSTNPLLGPRRKRKAKTKK